MTQPRALEAKFGKPCKSALVWKPQSTIGLDDEQGEKLLRLIETLEERGDVESLGCDPVAGRGARRFLNFAVNSVS